MERESSSRIATRTSWQISPCPDQREPLAFAEVYSLDEYERIKAGLIPVEMEDKWFIFFEGPWLFFHRSWTGFCIYGARFEHSAKGVAVVECWVSRNSEQYRGGPADYEAQLLKFLIDALLLNRSGSFPVPAEAANAPPGLYQHAMIGRAYPETIHAPEPTSRPKRSLWDWIRKPRP